MKLSKEQVNFLSDKLFQHLKQKELLVLKAEENKVKTKIASIIQKNIDDELKLDAEAKKILKDNEALMAGVNFSKIFQMTKKKLAEDKNFIL